MSRADQRVLRWFGHADEYRMVRGVLLEVEGGYGVDRSWISWIDGVKVALCSRGMAVEAARQSAKKKE